MNSDIDYRFKDNEKRRNRFYSLVKSCIINATKMLFNSKSFKITALSIFGFFFGISIAGTGVYFAKRQSLKSGIGGLETSSQADYNSHFDTFDETEELSQFQDELAGSTTTITPSPILTYQTYRVKKGDMIGYIASSFDVTQDTIISLNNIKQSRLIQVGQYLKIPSMPGILYTVKTDGETPETIAEKYEINAEKCAKVNSLAINTSLNAGTSIFVPDAELDWATRQEINGDLFHRPLRARYWLSSPFGWRDSPFSTGKRTFHGGIDMATSMGTPIYAALDGVVSAAGYNETYGNYVIITHHSGYKTLYGHMSRITCKKGNFVYTNTKIGEVGSTGMSTGPHLHFTVYKNGKSVNPLALIN